jgi:hypothetical protein
MTYYDPANIEAFRELENQRRTHNCTTECEDR